MNKRYLIIMLLSLNCILTGCQSGVSSANELNTNSSDSYEKSSIFSDKNDLDQLYGYVLSKIETNGEVSTKYLKKNTKKYDYTNDILKINYKEYEGYYFTNDDISLKLLYDGSIKQIIPMYVIENKELKYQSAYINSQSDIISDKNYSENLYLNLLMTQNYVKYKEYIEDIKLNENENLNKYLKLIETFSNSENRKINDIEKIFNTRSSYLDYEYIYSSDNTKYKLNNYIINLDDIEIKLSEIDGDAVYAVSFRDKITGLSLFYTLTEKINPEVSNTMGIMTFSKSLKEQMSSIYIAMKL